jgi:hypothetical protein
VDLTISATPVADRCIISSTQTYNLHRQTLAVEWPYWRAQWLSMWHHHRTPTFQQGSLSNICPARAALVNSKCCYCEVETSRSKMESGKPSQKSGDCYSSKGVTNSILMPVILEWDIRWASVHILLTHTFDHAVYIKNIGHTCVIGLLGDTKVV